MHRYLIVYTGNCLSDATNRTFDRARAHTAGWDDLCLSPGLSIWSRTSSASRLGHRRLQPHEKDGYLLGKDFPSQSFPAASEVSGIKDPVLRDRWGAYVVVRRDAELNGIRVLRDPTGRIPCWVYHGEGIFIVFSHLEDLRAILPLDPQFNWDYLRFHLFNRSLHGSSTGYQSVTEVLPGNEALIGKKGVSYNRLWQPERFAAHPYTNIDMARHDLRAAAELSIKNWANLYDSIALDLSGGLDSTIVLGLLKQVASHKQVLGINFVIAHAEGDERRYAREAAAFHGVELIEHDLEPGFADPLSAPIKRLLRPTLRTVPLGYDRAIAQIAQQRSLDASFTGTAGDHIFYDHLPPFAAIDYFRRNGVRGLIRKCHELAQTSNSTIWTTLASIFDDMRYPTRQTREWFKTYYPAFFKTNTLATRNDTGDDELLMEINESVLEAVGQLTPAKARQVINLCSLQTHYFRFGRGDLIEEVHPLFSQPLFEVILRIPSDWFCEGGVQRGLARLAFRDLIPDGIAARRTKSSNTSHWVRLLLENHEYYREFLLEGMLCKKGLLDRGALERALTRAALVKGDELGDVVNALSAEQWARLAA